MDMSTFNYGNANTLVTQDKYDPQQYNAQGQSLSPTPTGAPIAVDNTNDNRSAIDFKQQALQAQKDTVGIVDNENKIIGKSGYVYDKIDTSRKSQITAAAMNYFDAYMSHIGDEGAAVGAGARAASGAVNNLNSMAKRESLIHDLEDKGYNPIDIDKWRQTGDTKDLIVNKGSWTSDGKGYLHNTLTGEIKQVPGYQEQEQLTQVNLGDRIAFVNKVGQEVHSLPVGAKPGSTSATGGGIGLDEDENNGYVFEDGQWVQHTTYANGTPKIVVANAKMQDQLNSQATAGTPDANTQLVSDDLNKLESLPESEIDKFTGHVISKNETAQGVFAEAHGKEAQANLAASKRVSTQMGNAAISAAKSAGASGINTEAEIKRFTAGVPQIRYTSPEDYKQSLAEIKQYAENFKNQLIQQKTGKAAEPAAANVTHRFNPATGRIEAVQ